MTVPCNWRGAEADLWEWLFSKAEAAHRNPLPALGSGLGERSGCGRSFRGKNLGLGCDNGSRHGLWRNRLNRRNRLNDGFGVRRSLRLRCSHNFGNRLRDGFRRVFGGGHGFFDVSFVMAVYTTILPCLPRAGDPNALGQRGSITDRRNCRAVHGVQQRRDEVIQ